MIVIASQNLCGEEILHLRHQRNYNRVDLIWAARGDVDRLTARSVSLSDSAFSASRKLLAFVRAPKPRPRRVVGMAVSMDGIIVQVPRKFCGGSFSVSAVYVGSLFYATNDRTCQ